MDSTFLIRVVVPFALFLIAGCDKPAVVPPPTIEWDHWGEEILYNDTESHLIVLIREETSEAPSDKSVEIAPSSTETLPLPYFEYYVSIKNCTSLTINYGDGKQVKLEKGKDDWFNQYTLEQNDHYYMFDGRQYLADMKWPTYHYHITTTIIPE